MEILPYRLISTISYIYYNVDDNGPSEKKIKVVLIGDKNGGLVIKYIGKDVLILSFHKLINYLKIEFFLNTEFMLIDEEGNLLSPLQKGSPDMKTMYILKNSVKLNFEKDQNDYLYVGKDSKKLAKGSPFETFDDLKKKEKLHESKEPLIFYDQYDCEIKDTRIIQ